MKFQVAKQDLHHALSTVGDAVSSVGDISSHFLFRVSPSQEDRIEVLAQSNRLSASCPINASVIQEKGASFTVEAWRLRGWLNIVENDVLTIACSETGEVVCEAGKYGQTFRSLDPSIFPLWDKTLAKSEVTATVNADRLLDALKKAKHFASDDEAAQPEAVVLDMRQGSLVATDKKAAIVFFKMSGLEKSSLRVHRKDVPSLTNFLSTIDGDVEILENDRSVFFRRPSDGAVFGDTRYQVSFPNLSPPSGDDQRMWEVKTADLRKAIQSNYFGAAKGDDRVYFSRADDESPLSVSMKTESGKVASVAVAVVSASQQDGVPDLPSGGFPISYKHLRNVLDIMSDSDTVKLGVRVDLSKKTRFIRVLETTQHGDAYMYVLAGMVW